MERRYNTNLRKSYIRNQVAMQELKSSKGDDPNPRSDEDEVRNPVVLHLCRPPTKALWRRRPEAKYAGGQRTILMELSTTVRDVASSQVKKEVPASPCLPGRPPAGMRKMGRSGTCAVEECRGDDRHDDLGP